MRHLQLYETFNANPNWWEAHLDSEGYYKDPGLEVSGPPTEAQVEGFLKALESMGFDVSAPLVMRGSYHRKAELKIGKVGYIIRIIILPYRRTRSIAPEAKVLRFAKTPRRTDMEPYTNVRRFLVGDMSYKDYMSTVVGQGMTPEEAQYYAFGWDLEGSMIDLPDKTAYLSESFSIDGNEEQQHDYYIRSSEFYNEFEESLESLLPGSYPTGSDRYSTYGAEITKGEFPKLTDLVREKLPKVKALVKYKSLFI
jgi:hypothetical protein